MRTEERYVSILNEPLVEDLANLDTVVEFSNTIIFCPFIVFKYNDILYFLMPDREVDCRWTPSYTVLSTTPNSALELFKEGDNTCVLNFSTPDFTVDATDAACVDTDTCLLYTSDAADE